MFVVPSSQRVRLRLRICSSLQALEGVVGELLSRKNVDAWGGIVVRFCSVGRMVREILCTGSRVKGVELEDDVVVV